MNVLTLYHRANCHLCHVALKKLEQVRASIPFELRTVDIEKEMAPDDPRHSQYAIGVPVIELNGSVLFEGQVDVEQLRRRLTESKEPTKE